APPSTAKRPTLRRGRGASRPLRSAGDERRIDLVLLRDGGAMSLRGRTLLTARHGGRRRNGRFGQADDDLDPALAQRPHQLRQVLQRGPGVAAMTATSERRAALTRLVR